MAPSTDLDATEGDVVERFFAAAERGDADALTALVDAEMVMEWPQSGERFSGRANVLAAMGAVDVKPEFAGPRRLIGSGGLWVLTVPLRYGTEIFHDVAVLELEAGRIRQATG